eukprot:403360143
MDAEEVQASITIAIVSFISGIAFNGLLPFSSYLAVLTLLGFSANLLLQIQKVRSFYKNRRLREAFISLALGMTFINPISYAADYLPFRMQFYLASLALYHYAEYLYVCYFHYVQLSFDSFLLNQSISYVVAVNVSFLEFTILYNYYDFYEILPFPLVILIMLIGLIMVLIGHFFRIGAEFTAGANFNHKIQFHKDEKHKLVTHGLYAVSRHPSYFGWFMWAVGTQVFMLNPLSTLLFLATSFYFFKSRIEIEEEILLEFFEQEYSDYTKKVGILIPFIKGFQGYDTKY